MKIGGSNIAGICGVSPWSTPLNEFMKITGQVSIPDNPAMEWGRRLEPVILEKYASLTRRRVEANHNSSLFGIQRQHPDYPFLVGSLDGISYSNTPGEERVLEVKTARSKDAWIDGVPEYYQCQVQFYLACTGYQMADVAVLFAASEFEIFEMERDEELISILTQMASEFWSQHIVTMTPPDCTTPQDVSIRWPRSVNQAVEASEAIIQTIADLKALRLSIAAMETQKEELEAKIKAYLQDNDTLVYENKPVVTWKQSKDSQVFDKDNFIKQNYDLYKQFLITRPGSRRFLIK